MINPIRFNTNDYKNNTQNTKNNVSFGTHIDESLISLIEKHKSSLSEKLINQLSEKIHLLENDGNDLRKIELKIPDYSKYVKEKADELTQLTLKKNERSLPIKSLKNRLIPVTRGTYNYIPIGFYIGEYNGKNTEIKLLNKILRKLTLKNIDEIETSLDKKIKMDRLTSIQRIKQNKKLGTSEQIAEIKNNSTSEAVKVPPKTDLKEDAPQEIHPEAPVYKHLDKVYSHLDRVNGWKDRVSSWKKDF